jgi:hypothetical protein
MTNSSHGFDIGGYPARRGRDHPAQLSSPPSQEIASLAQDSNLHIDIDLDTNYLVLVMLDKEYNR